MENLTDSNKTKDVVIQTKEACALLGIKKQTFITGVANGEVSYVHFSTGGHGYLFSRNHILDIIEIMNQYFTIQEAAALLQIHKNDLLPLCRSNVLERKKMFGQWRFVKNKVIAHAAFLLEKKKSRQFFVLHIDEIKRRIQKSRMNYKDIAQVLDVSEGIVSCWLTGKKSPKEDNAYKLLTLFGYLPENIVIIANV